MDHDLRHGRRRSLAAAAALLLLWGCGKEEAPMEPESTASPVVFQGQEIDPAARVLSVSGETETDALRAALAALPEAETVEWELCPLTAEEQLALRAEYPELCFRWDVPLGGERYPSDSTTELMLDAPEDAETMADTLTLFDDLQTVRVEGRSLTNEEAALLRECCPGTDFLYTLDFFGQTLETSAEEIDLSGTLFEDTEALEAALVHFPHLKKVVMCECGLDNETMDALDRKYEDIRFVWLVNVFGRGVRTDASYFIQYNLPPCYLEGSRAVNLHYCTDLIALDLGHTGLLDWEMDFLPYMPHLQYLILADCHISDITDVANLTELTYFEAFKAPIRDYTPLLNCPLLTDLNICYNNYLDDEDVEVLRQMPQLERLWMYGARCSREKLDELMEALPDTNVQYIAGPESTGGGWRDHDHYRAMRDAFHMRYMW